MAAASAFTFTPVQRKFYPLDQLRNTTTCRGHVRGWGVVTWKGRSLIQMFLRHCEWDQAEIWCTGLLWFIW